MESLLAGITATICMLLGARLRFCPFKDAVTLRQRWIIMTGHITMGILQVAAMTVAVHIYGNDIAIPLMRISAIVFAVISFTINAVVIRKWLLEQLFVSGVVFTCNYVLMSVPNFIGSVLPEISDIARFFIIEDTYLVILMITHYPLFKMLYNTVAPFLKLDIGNYWNTIWFIPLALFGTRLVSLSEKSFPSSVSQLICDFLSAAVIILMCKSIGADCIRMRERQIVDKQLADQKLHYAELKIRVEDARRTKHDFKHHIAAIHHYIDIDDKEGLRNYCNDLLERSTVQDKIPYTGNAAADGVLYHYTQLAKDHRISLRYSGTIHSNGISDIDLCALLGNALDNALEGCMTISEDRSIDVICQSEKMLLSVVVHNTFDGRVDSSEKGVLSRKKKDRIGVGLLSMRHICEKYGGSFDTNWEGNTFTLMFMLPLSEEQ